MNGHLLEELKQMASDRKLSVEAALQLLITSAYEMHIKIDDLTRSGEQRNDRLDRIETSLSNQESLLQRIQNNPTVLLGDFIQKMPKTAKAIFGILLAFSIIALSNRAILRLILLGIGLDSAVVNVLAPP